MQHADSASAMARQTEHGSGYHLASLSDKNSYLKEDARSIQTMFDALESNKLSLNYQPINSVLDQKTCFFEVLLNLKNINQQSPETGSHISAVERFGLMAHFDRWVIRQVLKEFQMLQRSSPGVGIFVNLSGSNLDDESMFDYIRDQMAYYSVPYSKVCFEITETAAVADIDKAVQLVTALKLSGCKFALDDFGTGLSSLSYLKQFPLDFVKMDSSFIHQLEKSEVDQSILKAVSSLSDIMGFSLIAEGVEDKALLGILEDIGVNYVQGYAIGRPKPLQEVSSKSAFNRSNITSLYKPK
jgi:EAL domain-containing protein (putative c-di-GMP-specific phosphodiesterase class I)